MRLFAILSVLAAGVVGGGLAVTPAQAAPLCEKVWTSGTILGPHAEGYCEPYGNATLCRYEDAGADPQAHVYTYTCEPAPIEEP